MQPKSYKVTSGVLLLLLTLLVGCSTPVTQTGLTPSLGKEGSRRLPDFTQDTSAQQEDISVTAIGLIGTPYRWGGNTPDSGFDCSGLIAYVFANTRGKKIPRTTGEIARASELIRSSPIAPGDLIFFNTLGSPHSHVGIYVGKGRFVHAPTTGGTVRLDELRTPYWSNRFTEVRRLSGRGSI